MTVSRWRDSGHLGRAVETAGGRQAFGAAVGAMLDDARGWRLAEMRGRRGRSRQWPVPPVGHGVVHDAVVWVEVKGD